MKQNNFFSSETEIIKYLKSIQPATNSIVGIGDDAAVITSKNKMVVTTDSLVENVHFKKEWVTAEYLGRKAALINLSDVAAMGAIPRYALVGLILPSWGFAKNFIKNLYKGLLIELKPLNMEIIGGNITKGNELSITITLIGETPESVLARGNAEVGEDIFVTGVLGKAAYEVEQLLKCKKQQMEVFPPNRIQLARGLLNIGIKAAIDISDGFSLDLSRLLAASDVGGLIFEKNLPIYKNLRELALFGGEDYELIFTAKKELSTHLKTLGEQYEVPLTHVGEIKPKRFGIKLLKTSGKIEPLPLRGWDHVQKK